MVNDQLVEQIKRHEGFVEHAYQDTEGYWTIGFGRLIDKRLGGGISKGEATFMLRNDISNAYGELIRAYPWMDELDAARRDAFINMVFNLGLPRFAQFKKMLASAEQGDWSACAEHALDSRWATQVGQRAKELSIQIKTGQYT